MSVPLVQTKTTGNQDEVVRKPRMFALKKGPQRQARPDPENACSDSISFAKDPLHLRPSFALASVTTVPPLVSPLFVSPTLIRDTYSN